MTARQLLNDEHHFESDSNDIFSQVHNDADKLPEK